MGMKLYCMFYGYPHKCSHSSQLAMGTLKEDEEQRAWAGELRRRGFWPLSKKKKKSLQRADIAFFFFKLYNCFKEELH